VACQECWNKYYSKNGPLKPIYEEVSQEDLIVLQIMDS
jgi:hypothetical protein